MEHTLYANKNNRNKPHGNSTLQTQFFPSIGNAAGLASLQMISERATAKREVIQLKPGIPVGTTISYQTGHEYAWGKVLEDRGNSYLIKRIKLRNQEGIHETVEIGEPIEIEEINVFPAVSLDTETPNITTSIFHHGILSPKRRKAAGSLQGTFTQDALSGEQEENDYIHVNYFEKAATTTPQQINTLVEALIYNSARGAIPVAMENYQDPHISALFMTALPSVSFWDTAAKLEINPKDATEAQITLLFNEVKRKSQIKSDLLKTTLEKRLHKTMLIIANAPTEGASYDSGIPPTASGSEQNIKGIIPPASYRYVLHPASTPAIIPPLAVTVPVGDITKTIPLKFGGDSDSGYCIELNIPDYASGMTRIITEMANGNFVTHIVRL